MATQRICSIPGCDKKHAAKGYCAKHYYRDRDGRPMEDKRSKLFAFVEAALKSDTQECIIWPFGTKDSSKWAYGTFRHPETHKNEKAHRYVCTMAHGLPTSPKHQCRHACHNTLCINPKHLSWGTNRDNVHDSVRDGRRSIGSHRPDAELTDAIVAEIRQSALTNKEWAARLGVSNQIVSLARRGITWKHVKVPPQPPRKFQPKLMGRTTQLRVPVAECYKAA